MNAREALVDAVRTAIENAVAAGLDPDEVNAAIHELTGAVGLYFAEPPEPNDEDPSYPFNRPRDFHWGPEYR